MNTLPQTRSAMIRPLLLLLLVSSSLACFGGGGGGCCPTPSAGCTTPCAGASASLGYGGPTGGGGGFGAAYAPSAPFEVPPAPQPAPSYAANIGPPQTPQGLPVAAEYGPVPRPNVLPEPVPSNLNGGAPAVPQVSGQFENGAEPGQPSLSEQAAPNVAVPAEPEPSQSETVPETAAQQPLAAPEEDTGGESYEEVIEYVDEPTNDGNDEQSAASEQRGEGMSGSRNTPRSPNFPGPAPSSPSPSSSIPTYSNNAPRLEYQSETNRISTSDTSVPLPSSFDGGSTAGDASQAASDDRDYSEEEEATANKNVELTTVGPAPERLFPSTVVTEAAPWTEPPTTAAVFQPEPQPQQRVAPQKAPTANESELNVAPAGGNNEESDGYDEGDEDGTDSKDNFATDLGEQIEQAALRPTQTDGSGTGGSETAISPSASEYAVRQGTPPSAPPPLPAITVDVKTLVQPETEAAVRPSEEVSAPPAVPSAPEASPNQLQYNSVSLGTPSVAEVRVGTVPERPSVGNEVQGVPPATDLQVQGVPPAADLQVQGVPPAAVFEGGFPTLRPDTGSGGGADGSTDIATGGSSLPDGTQETEESYVEETEEPLPETTRTTLMPSSLRPTAAIERVTLAPIEPYKNAENGEEIITAHEQEIVEATGGTSGGPRTVVDTSAEQNEVGEQFSEETASARVKKGTKARARGTRVFSKPSQQRKEQQLEPMFFIIRRR